MKPKTRASKQRPADDILDLSPDGVPATLRGNPREEMLASTPSVDDASQAAQIGLPDKTGPPSPATDLLIGASAISLFLYGSSAKRRQVYHLYEKGNLPGFRLGGLLVARKSTLLSFLEAKERYRPRKHGGQVGPMNLLQPSSNHCSDCEGAIAAHASQLYAANRESDPDASHVMGA